jgi:hypothetical protein
MARMSEAKPNRVINLAAARGIQAQHPRHG